MDTFTIDPVDVRTLEAAAQFASTDLAYPVLSTVAMLDAVGQRFYVATESHVLGLVTPDVNAKPLAMINAVKADVDYRTATTLIPVSLVRAAYKAGLIMSKHTLEWLNNNVLIGFADSREQWTGAGGWVHDGDGDLLVPWFAGDDYTGSFPGPIPVEAVNERLFNWEAVSQPLQVVWEHGQNGDGYVPLDQWQAICRSDTRDVLGVHKAGYQQHQFSEWLIQQVANLVDDGELGIESALQLMGGAVAAVSISLPDVVMGAAKFPLLPKLLAYTSHNGKFSTTYKRTTFSPVCDNSLDVVTRGDGAAFRVKHSRYSQLKLASARDVLGVLWKQADEMVEFFDRLADWEVTNDQFRQVLDAVEPEVTEKVVDGKVVNQRACTTAVTKRTEIVRCYKHDGRANVWDSTALGALQAFNTWDQQIRGGIKTERVERQMLNTLGSDVATFDSIVLNSLSDVTGWHVEQDDDTRRFALVRN